MNAHTSATHVADAPRLLGSRSAPAAPSVRTIVGATIAALAVSAFVNHRLARKAERDNPPAGRFVHVDGVRMH